MLSPGGFVIAQAGCYRPVWPGDNTVSLGDIDVIAGFGRAITYRPFPGGDNGDNRSRAAWCSTGGVQHWGIIFLFHLYPFFFGGGRERGGCVHFSFMFLFCFVLFALFFFVFFRFVI